MLSEEQPALPCSMQFRRVLDQIRGRSYEEALMILEYLPYRAVEHILPTLMSVRSKQSSHGFQTLS